MPTDEPNPYAAPHANVAPSVVDSSTVELSEQEIKAFVGKRASYYLKKWPVAMVHSAADWGTSPPSPTVRARAVGFNWAAFLFSGIWMPYRKMYRATMIFYAIIIASSLAEQVVFVQMQGLEESPPALDRVLGLLVSVVFGSYANQWYLAHARRVVAEVRSLGLPPERYLQTLSQRGGANLAVGFGFFLLFIVAIFAVMFVFMMIFGIQ
jgi:Protein of unknown function (DUF2628)